MENLDLEMLAPYISMDDDFQLRALSPAEAPAPSPAKPDPAPGPASSLHLHEVCSSPSSPFSQSASPASSEESDASRCPSPLGKR